MLVLPFLLFLNGGFVQIARSQDFLPGFEEMPVMPGMRIIEGAGIHFDAASGRIAEAYATGNFSSDDVLRFYRTTLEQLGWQEINTGTFEREGETLLLGLEKIDDEITVRFRLSPVREGNGTATPTISK